jgi:prepilin-type processing-associated H-X9-DG protein
MGVTMGSPTVFFLRFYLTGLLVLAAFLIFILTASTEGGLLKIFLKKKWREIFKFCGKVNLIMTFTGTLLGVSFFMFNSLIHRLLPRAFSDTFFFFSWLILPVIIIWIKDRLYKHYWKDISAKRLMTVLIISNLAVYIMFSLLFFSQMHTGGHTGERARRISCSSNLKQIGLSLLQYSMDYNDYLPDKPGTAGFEQLRSCDYLTDPNCFVCPSKPNPKAENGQELTEKTVGYVYKSGYKYTSPDKSKTPVAWDKPDNHKNYGNVLFLDGHVQGFYGANWMEQAEIKKRK